MTPSTLFSYEIWVSIRYFEIVLPNKNRTFKGNLNKKWKRVKNYVENHLDLVLIKSCILS